MPWEGETYIYTKGILKAIARNYFSLYDGIPTVSSQITNPWAIAEYRADFDNALNLIGKGKWKGVPVPAFSQYKGFGKFQQIIIADVLGMKDEELPFYRIPQLRGRAYSWMADKLNGL